MFGRDFNSVQALVPPPVWPLPSDWKRANNAPDDSKWNKQCEHCNTFLRVPPGDPGAYRRHKRSLNCKKGSEMRKMHEQGMHVLQGKFVEILRPLVVTGTYYKYIPSTVASYSRWLDRNVRGSKENHELLKAFLEKSVEEQVVFLSGMIVEYEFKREESRR